MIQWTLGQELDGGRYVIENFIDKGSSSNTYRALAPRSGKLFAIKTLNRIQQRKPDFAQRQLNFINEALKLANCSHPNIVKVYEIVEADGLYGMVMEYINGETLDEYVREYGALSEATALRIIKQVGDALTFVHKRGFLHRDVKPDNIILRQDSQVPVLIDFSLAHEVTVGKLQSIKNRRTQYYAPIEQFERQSKLGEYTDVYAIAATLYTVLTYELPMPAKVRAEYHLPIFERDANISDRTKDAIIEGTTLRPQDRPQSVQAWLELLMPASEDLLLISAVGADYSKLRGLLAIGKWREADQETERVMVKVAGREEKGWLDYENIDNFPCEDLHTIDQLWVKYSNGRFGFSVQKRLWIEFGNVPGQRFEVDIDKEFSEIIGWREKNQLKFYQDLNFSLDCPYGHLPYACFGWIFATDKLSYLTLKMVSCNL